MAQKLIDLSMPVHNDMVSFRNRLRHDVALTDGCDGSWTRPVREPLRTPGHSGRLWASVEAREAIQSAFDRVLDVNLKGAMFQARRAPLHGAARRRRQVDSCRINLLACVQGVARATDTRYPR